MTDLPIIIVGANGKTGRRVAERLTELGQPIREVSRSTTPAFDWNDTSGWADALRGIRAAYVTYHPDLSVPGADEAIETFCRIADEQGVEHIVLLSGRGEDGAQRAEDKLKASGVPWTVLRASWFNQNFSESFLLDGVLAGHIALPVSDVREPFIDIDDIAEVAVAALNNPKHRNRLYELTGPEALTFQEAVDQIAQAADRPIQFQTITTDRFVTGLREDGVPDGMIGLLHELFTQVLDGRNSAVADGVQRALGRPARSFTDFTRSIAQTGVWQPCSVAS